MKYKVGERVRVNTNLEAGEEVFWYIENTLCFNYIMASMPIVTIKEIDEDIDVYNVFENPYAYCESMLYGVWNEKHDQKRN